MVNLRKVFLLMFVAAICLFTTACGGGTSKDNTKDTGTKQEVSGSLVVSGSSAMQPLVAAAAEEFMNANPKVDIQVNAGGSGTGLSQVAQGSVQIGNSDVFAEEKEGIPADQLVDHKVAVVGITAAVNPNRSSQSPRFFWHTCSI